jgi:hypothetical protein
VERPPTNILGNKKPSAELRVKQTYGSSGKSFKNPLWKYRLAWLQQIIFVREFPVGSEEHREKSGTSASIS